MDRITTKEFIRVFKDISKHSSDKKFCFILGAGASKSSGIPTGEEMSKYWLDEIRDTLEPESFNEWKEEFGIDENNPGQFYGLIYQKRFLHNLSSGYDFLNQSMKHAKPGFGYSVIAQLLSTTKNNIVITTNFDSLTEEALYRYSYKKFLVCGHESLTGFATPSADRPLIAKIHRDLLMNPQNRPDETSMLAEGWKNVLDNIFKTYIPVVIGYGGNDGSLMGYFENLENLDNIFWCCMKTSRISDRIKDLLKKRNGRLVETGGFDHLMYEICIAGELGLLSNTIVKVAEETARNYEKSVREINESRSENRNSETESSSAVFSKMAKGNTAFDYYLRIVGEKNEHEREKLLDEAIRKFPESSELNNRYAIHMLETKNDPDEAEKFYKRAIELDPVNSKALGNYASFLERYRGKLDESEKYYLRSLELDPNSVRTNANYATFLNTARRNFDKAETYFRKAIMLEPTNVINNANYAVFLKDVRKNFDEAEKFYEYSLKNLPELGENHGYYAIYLSHIKKNYKEAEKHFLRAIELEPDDPLTYGNYAQLLLGLGRKDEGEKNLNKAFELGKDLKPYMLELWFYVYCHFPERLAEAKENIERLLSEGYRSPDWDFSINIERAEKNGHPEIKTIKEFGRRIRDVR